MSALICLFVLLPGEETKEEEPKEKPDKVKKFEEAIDTGNLATAAASALAAAAVKAKVRNKRERRERGGGKGEGKKVFKREGEWGGREREEV